MRLRFYPVMLGAALAIGLAGCSLFGSAQIKGDRPSLLAYVSQPARGTVLVVSTIDKSYVAEIAVGGTPINMLADPTTGRELLYVVDNNASSINLVNRRNGTVETAIASGQNPWGLAMTAGAAGAKRYLYVTNPGDRTVARIDPDTRQRVGTFNFNNIPGFVPRGIASHPTRNEVYIVSEALSGNNQGQVIPITESAPNSTGNTTATQGSLISLTGAVQPWQAAVNRSGMLYITDRGTENFFVINTASLNAAAQTVPTGAGRTYDVAANPVDGTVYMSMPDRNAVLAITGTTPSEISLTTDVTSALGPQPIAVNQSGTEVWVGAVGSNHVLYLTNQDPTQPVGAVAANTRAARPVNYSANPGQVAPPGDIVFAAGVQ